MFIKSLLRKSKLIMNIYNVYYKRFGSIKYTHIQKEFIKLNSRIWLNSTKKADSNKIILVSFSTPAPDAFWLGMKKAEAYKEKYGYKIWAVLNGHFKDNDNIASILESYGIDKIIYRDSKKYFKEYKKEAIKLANQIYNSKIEIMDFIKTELDGVIVGDLIYDWIMRHNNLYTLKTCDRKYIYDVFESVRIYLFYKKIFEKKPVTVFITNEAAYQAAIPLRTAAVKGIVSNLISEYGDLIYSKDNLFSYIMDVENQISPEDLLLKLKTDIDFKNKCEKYFEKRLAGQIVTADAKNAYGIKKDLLQDELKKRLKIDNGKKNILIAPHVFCDACHNYQQWIFRDYYDWLEYTLQTIGNRTDINLLFKSHPTAAGFGKFEIDGLNNIVSCYSNLIILPTDISTTSVLRISDVVITAGGTIGLEASCLGIPSVNVCKSYYNKFGFINIKKTKEKYKEFLDHITDLKKNIDEEQLLLAKAVLFLSWNKDRDSKVSLFNLSILPGDNFQESIETQYSYLNGKLTDINNIKDQEYKRWLEEI